MKTRDFSFSLPRELIAQYPADRRDASRLLVVDRSTGGFTHSHTARLPDFLEPGSVVVVNDSKVRKARIYAVTETGARFELLLAEPLPGGGWGAIISKAGRRRPGQTFVLDGGAVGTIGVRDGELTSVTFDVPVDDAYLELHGHVPLPPYIKRPDETADSERYQTIYARVPGSAAAPTAGLHISPAILDALASKGITVARVTLHVGLGTFLPIRTDEIEEHEMHEEEYEISGETARTVTQAKREGRQVTAVGTTSVRTLESAWSDGGLKAGRAKTRLFIYPGYAFNVVDRLFTNFHTPESSLIVMVSAFAGKALIDTAYREAVDKRYRFFSYGDAMLIQ